jgi:hypothetical protein
LDYFLEALEMVYDVYPVSPRAAVVEVDYIAVFLGVEPG